MFASIASIDSGQVLVTLRVTVEDADDGAHGNLGDGRVTSNTDGVPVVGPLAIQVINPEDTTTATVTRQSTTEIKNALRVSFTAVVEAGGYNNGENLTVVDVSKPAPDFITGGGYLVNQYSAGTYAGAPSIHTNFGLNVKFNKQLTNLQGNVNIIVRQDESVYQIKANAMNSLVVDPVSSTATITTKANLTDITDPFNPRLIAGNLILAVNLTDGGEPGSSDSIGLTLWGTTGTLAGRLLFSSRWDGIQTVEQNLAGGNLAVHAAGQALEAAGGAGATAAGQQMLTLRELQPLAEQAIAAWSIAGLDRELLGHLPQVELRVADLSGSTLGLAFANTIWIDRDAAGYGWRVDVADSAGKMDLLSVVTHEFGHTLGFEHSDERALMSPTLAAGVQTVIVPDPFAENLFAASRAHFFGFYLKQSASSWLRNDTVLLDTLDTEWEAAEKAQTLRTRDGLFAALAAAEQIVAVEGSVKFASDDEVAEAIGDLPESLAGAAGQEETVDKATEHLFDDNLAELLALGL